MTQVVSELSLVEAFFYIVLGWVLISIWERFFENFVYRSLPLKRNLAYHNFIVAFVASAIFLVIVGFASAIIQNDVTSIFSSGPGLGPISPPFGGDPIPETTLNDVVNKKLTKPKEKDVHSRERKRIERKRYSSNSKRRQDFDIEEQRRRIKKNASRSKTGSSRTGPVRDFDGHFSQRRSTR